MFEHDFQGGASFEIFSPQGRDPVANWKLTGNAIKKGEYDKEVKGYVYNLEGSAATTRMQLPKESKYSLGLIQRYLILQVNVPKGADFSIDLGITDLGNQKRRLILSTTYKETQLNPLHSKIPLGMIKRATWLNLILDLLSLVGESWRGQTHKALESICVSANCKLRRMFTMKCQPADTTDDEELFGFSGTNSGEELDSIPKPFLIAHDVNQEVQVINMTKVRYFEGKGRPVESGGSATSRHSINCDIDLNSSGGKRQSGDYHIAFGTKISGSGRTEPRKGSGGTSSRQQKSSHSRTTSDGGSDSAGSSRAAHPPRPERLTVESAKGQSVRERKNSDPGTNMEDPEITVDKESLRTSHTWTDGADNKEDIPFVRPHPPSKPSSVNRRKPRVKSAGKERSGGKERTPHHGRSVKEQGASPQSSYHPSQASSHQMAPQPSQVADDREEERFMREMQQSVQRDQLKSESESDPGSQNTSGNQDDESMTEVINALKEGDVDNIRNYEDSEEEDPQEDDDVIYTYSSVPKLPMTSHSVKTKKSHQPSTKKNNSKRKRVGPESRLDMDFVRVGSTDEDDSMRADLWPQETVPVIAKTSPHLSSVVSAGQQSKKNGFMNIPAAGQLKSPVSSQSRVSINKSSLRVIPKEEIRRSGGTKPYQPSKYEMIPDLADSFEAQMLLQLQKENLGEGMESDEDEEANKRQNGGLTRSKINYGDDNLSDASDDTSTSTMRHGALEVQTHNYQDEMKILSQEFLAQSNPRDWGNVFSPPIVLPSNTANGSPTKYNLSPGNKDQSPQYYNPNNNSQLASAEPQSQDPHDMEEDKLELLFDPVLNVYFDPKSCTYYELKT